VYDGGLLAENEGCRLGIRGRGGVGKWGYRVRMSEERGDVGDFSSAAAASSADSCFRFCFLCRVVSSFCLILIDLRAGPPSSLLDDAGPGSRTLAKRTSLSPSEPDVGGEVVRGFEERKLRFSDISPSPFDCDDPERPTAFVVDLLPIFFGLPFRRSLLIGSNVEKCPSSVKKHATM